MSHASSHSRDGETGPSLVSMKVPKVLSFNAPLFRSRLDFERTHQSSGLSVETYEVTTFRQRRKERERRRETKREV